MRTQQSAPALPRGGTGALAEDCYDAQASAEASSSVDSADGTLRVALSVCSDWARTSRPPSAARWSVSWKSTPVVD